MILEYFYSVDLKKLNNKNNYIYIYLLILLIILLVYTVLLFSIRTRNISLGMSLIYEQYISYYYCYILYVGIMHAQLPTTV